MSKKLYYLYIWLIFASLVLLAAGEINPTLFITTKSFSVDSTYGMRTTIPITIREQGCIWAQATWPTSSSAKTLALILNGPGSTSAYRRQDGKSGVVLAYSITESDARKGTSWSISIANFGGGTAKGQILIEYPPTQVPCELKAVKGSTTGRVDLSWKYTGKTIPVSFLVERSNDDKFKSPKVICTSKPSASKTSYICSDSGVKSRTVYYYRVCSVSSSKASACSTTNVLPFVSIQVP